VSTIEDIPQPVEDPALPDDQSHAATPSQPRNPPRRRWLAVAGAVVALAAIGGGTAAWKATRHEVPATTPITLPSAVSGLPTLTQHTQYGSPAWQLKARTAAGGTAIDAKQYGKEGSSRTIRLVAARTDLTGKLDLAWAADTGHEAGSARCTHNTKLTASGQPRNRPTVLVCWRTSATLSVYSVIIDPKATSAVPDSDGEAAVDAGWKAARRGR
jgi:hypothetical protein